MIAFARRRPTITTIDGEVFTVDRIGLIEADWPRSPDDPPSPAQIRLARQWLVRLERIKSPTLNSYKLKHAAERWLASCDTPTYLSNGALIVAADRMGIGQRAGYGTPNTRLAVSRRSYHALTESMHRPAFVAEVSL